MAKESNNLFSVEPAGNFHEQKGKKKAVTMDSVVEHLRTQS